MFLASSFELFESLPCIASSDFEPFGFIGFLCIGVLVLLSVLLPSIFPYAYAFEDIAIFGADILNLFPLISGVQLLNHH